MERLILKNVSKNLFVNHRSFKLKNIKIKIINPLMGSSIPLPEYETDGSAGLDLRACLDIKLNLEAGMSKLIPI